MLYIMRHGKTDWNTLHKLQGQIDIPLNEEGKKMAAEAAIMYSDIKFDLCYCSPLVRAKETAEIFLKDTSTPILYDNRLMEMGFGELEGVEALWFEDDTALNHLFSDPVHYEPKGGETFDELFDRTRSFIEEIIKPQLKDNKNILIIGHGAMNSSILCQIRNIPLEHFWDAGIENCRLMQLL